MVHAKTRKKSFVEKLAVEGLGTPFSRVQEIQDNITRQLCQQYHGEEIVCPKKHRKRIIYGCRDCNVDDESSSATAKCSFHRTSISIYQRNEINLSHKKFSYENKTHFK